MNVHNLSEMAPWDWPDEAGQVLSDCIDNPRLPDRDRLLAASMAGQLVVMNNDMAEFLLSVVEGSSYPDAVRAAAAISLGPALEMTETDFFGDVELQDGVLSEPLFLKICQSLHDVFQSESIPKLVRRRALEASVRTDQDWHEKAIWDLLATNDEDWRITALFAMRYVPGEFGKPILEALATGNTTLQREAALAVGPRQVDSAWPIVSRMVESPTTEKSVLLAAIVAVADLRPNEAGDLLENIADSDDDEIAETVEEALLMIKGGDAFEEEDEEEFDGDVPAPPSSKGDWVH